MADITTRSGKGSALSHTEVDANFTNLNTAKYESGDDASFSSLAVDGDTLYVDKTNNRVGINTDEPTEELEIVSGSPGVRLRDSGDNSYGRITYNAGDLFVIADDQDDIAGSTMYFQVDGINKAALRDDGTFGLDAGNGDGYGLTFGSTSHDAATTLDWYEEGTWTPSLNDSFTGGNAATISDIAATYTRIGNIVYCTFAFRVDSVTGMGTSYLYMRSLPFARNYDSSHTDIFPVLITHSSPTVTGDITGMFFEIIPGSDYGRFTAGQTGANTAFVVSSDLTAGSTYFKGSFFYRAQ